MTIFAAVLLALAGAASAAAPASGDPPLVAAIKKGDLSALQAQLAQGADVGAKDQYGWTATMWAVGHANAPMLAALLNAGGDPAPAGAPAFNAMIEAAKGDRPDVVALLAARGFACGAKDAQGVPALAYATAKVSTGTVAALLACKADVNAKDANGFTPLIRAVPNGQAGTASFLLAHGARPNARDGRGYTALMWAAHDGAAAAAKALLAAKADPAIKGKDGLTAYAIATARGRTDVAALLPAAP
jgi:ankyrin repeat protein